MNNYLLFNNNYNKYKQLNKLNWLIMGNGDALDVSGSMSGSRIIMAKKALIQLIKIKWWK